MFYRSTRVGLGRSRRDIRDVLNFDLLERVLGLGAAINGYCVLWRQWVGYNMASDLTADVEPTLDLTCRSYPKATGSHVHGDRCFDQEYFSSAEMKKPRSARL